ncbi:hypothetical protein KSP40_PGU000438 [Platanthera guangdongensis]|uniref:Uncharacterized protein n=1 Tax=Platanthera guangdongensis TaxID=2320717 RepID=A0ABR2MHZ6_9ASPA
MPQYVPGIAEPRSEIEVSERNSDGNQFSNTCSARDATGEPLPSHTLVVSKPEEVTDAKGEGSKSTAPELDEKAGVVVKEQRDCQQCRFWREGIGIEHHNSNFCVRLTLFRKELAFTENLWVLEEVV